MSDHDTGFVDNGAARRTLRRLKLRRQQQELLCDIIEARRKLVERERARRKAEAAKRERVFAALSRLVLIRQRKPIRQFANASQREPSELRICHLTQH